MKTCIHFVAAGQGCRAGVRVESLRDAELRLPCHEIKAPGAAAAAVSGELPCASREWPPAASPPMAGVMSGMLEKISSRLCPFCGLLVVKEIEVGENVLASPCRHILFKIRDLK